MRNSSSSSPGCSKRSARESWKTRITSGRSATRGSARRARASSDEGVEDLANVDASRRKELVGKYVDESADRVPLLAYGANGSPERLALKLAHLPEGHREALILAGNLEGFDVGAAAQPPVFSSMPATLIPSSGTAVRVAVLFLTPIQFTALWWTELSYKVGALT